MDYEKLYHIMFNAVTDALRCMEAKDHERAEHLLMSAQIETEQIYMNNGK